MSQAATSQKFSTGVRFSHNFGTLETLSFFGEGVGAALYITAIITGQLAIAALGVGFVFVAVTALLAHLGKPLRSWRAATKLGNAWVSRGTLSISIFMGFATLSIAAAFIDFIEPFRHLLTVAALVFSVPVIIYAGMLLRSMRAIRLWRGPFVPLAFSAHSVATGLTIVWALAPLLGADVSGEAWLQPAAMGALLLCAAISAAHLLRVEPSEGTQASLHRLMSGDLRAKLTWGAGVLGIVVPLAAMAISQFLFASFGPALASLVFVGVALCRLYGDFAYRNAIVTAGAYEPIFPSGSNRTVPKGAPWGAVGASSAHH